MSAETMEFALSVLKIIWIDLLLSGDNAVVIALAVSYTHLDVYKRQVVHASEHPTATFTLTSPLTIEKVPASGEVTEQTLSGDLTLAGLSLIHI